MDAPDDTPTPAMLTTKVADLRGVPIAKLTGRGNADLRRIVPPAETTRVPVAAFNASL